MLKDIKISNNKLNIVTLTVILLFLAYFSACFGVSINYLNTIANQVTTNAQLYQEQPALQYTYLYFLTDILLDSSETTPDQQTRYQNMVTSVYSLLDDREQAKINGNNWLLSVDNATFCSVINNYISTAFEQQ